MVLFLPDKLARTYAGVTHGALSLYCLLHFPAAFLYLLTTGYDFSRFPGSFWALTAQLYFVFGALSGIIALAFLPIWKEMHTTSSETYLKGMTPLNIQRTHKARIASFIAYSLLGAYFAFGGIPRALLIVPLCIHVGSVYVWLRNKYDPIGVMTDAGGFAIALELMVAWFGDALVLEHPLMRPFYVAQISSTCYFFTYAYFFYYLLNRGYVQSTLALCLWVRYVHLGLAFYAPALAALLFFKYGVAAQPAAFWALPIISVLWLPIVRKSVAKWKYIDAGACRR
jgi:hypothetical protein